MPRLLLDRLRVRDLRNLVEVDLAPAARVNVISGNNGHGKTSLLEAIYFAATSRSFRTPRPAELLRHGAAQAVVKARFLEAGEGGADDLPPLAREQVASVGGRGCTVRIDGVDYWDGGYGGNPAIWPLVYGTPTEDVLLVRINPLVPGDAKGARPSSPGLSRRALLVGGVATVAFVPMQSKTSCASASSGAVVR